jgi:hypothetical protein
LFETVSRIKIVTGALILAALLLLWYSGVKLLRIYDTPLVGVSSESRLAKQKWNNLEDLMKEREKRDWSKSIDTLIKEIPVAKPETTPENPVSSQEIEAVDRYEVKDIPPVIMGITIPSDTLNKQKALVLINGITYSENDEVSGYLIEKITKEGVSFKKNGQRFFVDAPEILYSVDQGD